MGVSSLSSSTSSALGEGSGFGIFSTSLISPGGCLGAAGVLTFRVDRRCLLEDGVELAMGDFEDVGEATDV